MNGELAVWLFDNVICSCTSFVELPFAGALALSIC